MNITRVVCQLARADFFERIRRFSFAVTLVVTVIAAYIFVPAPGGGYTTLDLGDGHRGVYNSAWVGAQVAMLTAVFLSLFGFYLVRNTINRDRVTRVGQIIAATPVSKPVYTLGKWLSNCAVLGLIGIIVLIGAAVLQLVRGEDMSLKPLLLISPFLTLLPVVIAVISAIAVLFECISFLSGAFGNIVYFFVFPQLMTSEMLGGPRILGVSYFIDSMVKACRTVFPTYVESINFGITFHEGRTVAAGTFVWNGMPISPEYLLSRVLWLLVAVGIAVVAAIPFNRFESSKRQRAAGTARKPRFAQLRRWLGAGASWSGDGSAIAPAPGGANAHVHLTPLAGRQSHARYGGIFLANLRLALRSMPWWWHIGAVGLIICEVFIPWEGVQRFVLPAALLWPTIIWASLGNREIRHATHQIVFSAAHPLRRQLSAAWLTGAAVALLLVSGAGLRWMIAGDWLRVAAVLAGAAFVPSLALALGGWSKTTRLFEVLYLFWWYVGPLQAIPFLDYAGTSPSAGTPGTTAFYAVAALILLTLGFLGVRRQLTA